MEIEAIKALPVAELADRNCALFLWITLPKLCEAWCVMEAWGFEYRTTAFVWIKLNPKSGTLFWGPGYWTHANAELCLLGIRGHPKRQARNIHQVILAKREEHSKKPEETRRRIEALMGDLPRVELFARRPAPGRDVCDNEEACTADWPAMKERREDRP